MARKPLDLIITDLTLNGCTRGGELAEIALMSAPQTWAVVVTGHLPQVNPLADRYAQRAVTLAKPLTPATLVAALATLPIPAGRQAPFPQR